MMTTNRLNDLPDLPEPVQRINPRALAGGSTILARPIAGATFWAGTCSATLAPPENHGLDGSTNAGLLHPVH